MPPCVTATFARDLECRLAEAEGQVVTAIEILDGVLPPIKWREGGTQLLRKSCAHLEAFGDVTARAEHAEAEWQAQAALVKASVDREAETHTAYMALVEKQDGLNLKFAYDLIAVMAERDAFMAQVAMLREALETCYEDPARDGGLSVLLFDAEKVKSALSATPALASAELAALREDKARINAFRTMLQTEFHSTPLWQDGAWCIPRLMDGSGGFGGGVVYDRYESFTKAIDAARKASP